MRLNAVSPLCLAVLTALAPSLAFAEAPSAPSNLRAEVYSNTAGEIFWSRSTDSNGVVVGYEVFQDGELITSRDALSYFADNLTDGVTSTFSVIAVDNDGERSETVSIDVTTGVNGNASETGDRPLPPANLFATVYSATAAEVFFDRNIGPALTYEVFLDGVVVATIDGTSFFFGDLTGGQNNNVDVVAINASGVRSGAASVQFNTTGGTSGGGDNPPVASAIDAPANLRLEVYSATAGELFWGRSSQTDLIETTEVRRDGVVISTTDGTSFFDDTRVPGVAYLYEVTFISVDGGQSDASVVDETGGIADTGGDDNDSPSIDDIVVNGNVITVPDDGDIYQVQDSTSFAPFCEGLINCEVVPGTYNVINLSSGDRFEGIFVSGESTPEPVTNSLSLDQDNAIVQAAVSVASLSVLYDLDNFVRTIQFSDRSVEECDDGGTKLLVDRDIGLTFSPPIVDVTLDNCAMDGQIIDGQVILLPFTLGSRRRYSSTTYTNQAGTTINITGDYRTNASGTGVGANSDQSWEVDTLDFIGEESLAVTNLNADFLAFPSPLDSLLVDVISYTASFEFVGEATDDVSYQFNTITELVRAPDGPFYDSGIFRIENDLNTSLDVNFGTGDPATLMLTLQNESGSEDSSEVVADSLERLFLSVPNVNFVR